MIVCDCLMLALCGCHVMFAACALLSLLRGRRAMCVWRSCDCVRCSYDFECFQRALCCGYHASACGVCLRLVRRPMVCVSARHALCVAILKCLQRLCIRRCVCVRRTVVLAWSVVIL